MSVSKVNSPPTMNTLISKINEIIDALNSGGGGSGDVSGKVDKIHTISGSTGTIDNADFGPVLSFLDDTTFEGGSLSAFTGLITMSYMCNDYSSYNISAKADGLHWSYTDSGFVDHTIIDADDSTITIGDGQDVVITGVVTPTSNTDAANKQYVDGLIEDCLPASNGTATNLDNATQTGIYSYSSSATNAPVSANGTLLVFRTSSTYQFQLAFPNNSSGNPVIYTRIHRSAGWGAWKTLSYS